MSQHCFAILWHRVLAEPQNVVQDLQDRPTVSKLICMKRPVKFAVCEALGSAHLPGKMSKQRLQTARGPCRVGPRLALIKPTFSPVCRKVNLHLLAVLGFIGQSSATQSAFKKYFLKTCEESVIHVQKATNNETKAVPALTNGERPTNSFLSNRKHKTPLSTIVPAKILQDFSWREWVEDTMMIYKKHGMSVHLTGSV